MIITAVIIQLTVFNCWIRLTFFSCSKICRLLRQLFMRTVSRFLEISSTTFVEMTVPVTKLTNRKRKTQRRREWFWARRIGQVEKNFGGVVKCGFSIIMILENLLHLLFNYHLSFGSFDQILVHRTIKQTRRFGLIGQKISRCSEIRRAKTGTLVN